MIDSLCRVVSLECGVMSLVMFGGSAIVMLVGIVVCLLGVSVNGLMVCRS